MLKIFKKASIIVLSFIVAFVLTSTVVNANDYSDFEKKENEASESNDYLSEIEEKSQYLDIFEIESLREAGVKHFRLEDGSYRAISYGQVVHQKDANGRWQDIDNTLRLNNGFYKTADGRLSFSQNVDSLIPFYELNKGDFSLSFSALFNPINRVIASVDNQDESLNELGNSIESISKIKNNSHISYEGIYEGVNLDFYLYANTISMMLNLDSTFDDNQVKFILETENVEAEIDNGCLVLIDPITSIIKYKLFKPYLNSCDESPLNDYYYSLSKICDGRYEIVINFDFDDSNDSNDEQLRIPPGMGPEIVIIDDGGGGGSTGIVYDTYISSSSPSTNYGYSSEVKVSSNNTDIGLIRINNPSIPAESTVVDAFFTIPYYYSSNTSNYARVAAYQILSNWYESNVTWNSSPSMSQTQLGSDYALGGATSTNPSTISLDITSLAKKWYSEESSNYGIACKHIGGTSSTVLFKSWESYSERATLTIDYNLDSLIISNGMYFIKNGHLDKYIQIDDGDSGNNYNTEGAILELWTGTGVSFQKWIFEYLHNGYYKIKSYRSGKVISVQSGYENTGARALRQETYTGSYRQQWSITLTSHGMYKIKPRSSEGYSTDWVMCCGEGIGGNGRNVEQREYSNNAIYKDEWIIEMLLPLSGYELDYDTSIWSGSPSNYNNCYAYALNNQVYPGTNNIWLMQQPGEYYGSQITSIDADEIIEAVKNDFIKYNQDYGLNVSFITGPNNSSLDANFICPAGTYKVALVLSSYDYHWYRQDSDGYWSHKRGNTPITRLDNSGNLIVDPRTANRDGYSIFVGFFAVTGWNNLYNSSKGSYEHINNDIVGKKAIVYASKMQVDSIKLGMRIKNVVNVLGSSGKLLNTGVIMHEYQICGNKKVILQYRRSNNNYYVCQIIWEG